MSDTKPLYFLFVCGIRSNTADNGWYDTASLWVETHTPHKAGVYEYETTATLRWWGQSRRAAELANIIWELQDTFRVVVVAHSNGCELLARVLREWLSARVHAAFFLAPAVDFDFKKNGLARAIEQDRLGSLTVFYSRDDEALRLAKETGWFMRLFSNEYGYLGLGPQHARYDQGRVNWINCNGFGHSSYTDDMLVPFVLPKIMELV